MIEKKINYSNEGFWQTIYSLEGIEEVNPLALLQKNFKIGKDNIHINLISRTITYPESLGNRLNGNLEAYTIK